MTTGDEGPPRGRAQEGNEALTTGEALALFGVAYLLLYFVFVPLQIRSLVPGLIVSEYLGLLGLPIVFLRLIGRRVRPALGLTAPAPRAILAAALMGSAGWVVADLLTLWIFPPPKELVEQLRRMLFPHEGGRGWLANLMLFAVTPAVCEEVFFRGALLRGLLQRLRPLFALCVCALAFGIFHIDPYRLLPTTLLGLMLSFIAWKSDSLWPSVLTHFVNNGVVITLSATELDRRLEDLGTAAHVALFGVALSLVAAGGVLLHRGPRVARQV